MKIGTYYYPEQWPRSQWERDFDNIALMGLQIVHMAEFAWFSMEPAAGEFRFDWLEESLRMTAERKLDVILCTPTCVPPVWLVEQHPDVLIRDEHGTSIRHGGRRHASPTSPALFDASARIVQELANRFGDHPSVIGWQLDNEYSSSFIGQNDHTHAAFREWLKRRYETIERLNEAWGCQFWNTQYTDWRQIMLPASRNPNYANPHQHLDGSRFWSAAYARFNKHQADILKPKIGSRFITTNFMPFHLDCDPGEMQKELSLYSWDSYPVTGHVEAATDEMYRIGDPDGIAFTHDQMASYTGRWALIEVQLGQLNWSGVPVLVNPQAVRLWLWTAFAHGSEFITTYRYRQPRFGIELFHHALVSHDGVTPTPGGRQFEQTIDEVALLDLKRAPGVSEEEDADRTIGILFDFDQLWYYKTMPQAARWDQPRWLLMWYHAAARLGLRVRILHPDNPLPTDLRAVIAPGVQMVDETLVQRWRDYARAGGHLVLTCRTALMDRTGQIFEGPTAAPILDLIGGTIEAYDGLPANTFGQIEFDSKRDKYRWGVWGDLLYTEEDSRVIARYADQFYEGAAAILENPVGKGLVTYCGVYPEQPLVDALVQRVATQVNYETTLLPERVHLLRRGPYHILLNYQDETIEAPAPANAVFVIGTRSVEAAGVAVWQEE